MIYKTSLQNSGRNFLRAYLEAPDYGVYNHLKCNGYWHYKLHSITTVNSFSWINNFTSLHLTFYDINDFLSSVIPDILENVANANFSVRERKKWLFPTNPSRQSAELSCQK